MKTRLMDLGPNPTPPNTGPTPQELARLREVLGTTKPVLRRAGDGNVNWFGRAASGSTDADAAFTITRVTITGGTHSVAKTAALVPWDDGAGNTYATASYVAQS